MERLILLMKRLANMRRRLLSRLLSAAICVLFAFASFAQEKVITGKVTDEKGTPLNKATVAVTGSGRSTTTDAQGNFTLSVPANARRLTVSYVSMQPFEVSIENSTNVSVQLTPTENKLNEVVVIGYGTARKANLTTAQTSVSSKEIEKTVNTTIEQALQGRAAGVYITQNSGQPGGGMSVTVRGISTLNFSTEPLYVIDGIQMPGGQISFGATSSSNALAGLNPNDIEDVQILQGPSATAIYGSRATNGVIIITTKRGKAGDPKLNYSFQYNIQGPPKRLDVMNLREYAQMRKEFHEIAGGVTPGEFLDPSLLGEGTDWQRELFRSAPMQKHSLSLSGGSNNSNYYMSGEYLNQKGVALGSGFRRYGFRVNLDNKPKERISLGANLSFNQTNEDLTTSQENIISNALTLTPQVPVKNLNGTWGGGDVTNGANQFAPVNPIAIASLTTNKNVRRQFMGGLNLGVNIIKGLTFRTSFNTNLGWSNWNYYQPTYAIGWAINATATLQTGTGSNTYWNWNQLLEYSKAFGKHTVGAMVSHESQESTWKNLMGRRTGFLTNDILDLNAGDPTTGTNSGGSGTWGMESYLGRINYNYDDRYLFTATLRRDGSVNFGPERRWGTFPSASAAWRISQEEFFDVPLISELKLRVETGTTGNQGGGSGIYSPLATGATTWGTGFIPTTYTNPFLQWEDTRTDNVGINIGLLNNRISLEGDYYIKHTGDMIMTQLLPAYMGTSGVGSVRAPFVNTGDLTTKGWSFSLNSINIASTNFRWETNLNLSHFKSVIKRLNAADAFIERTSWWLNNWTQRSSVGFEPWLFRGYIQEGLFTSLDEISKSAVPVDNQGNRLPIDEQNGLWVGDVKFKDVNGDDKIDVKDMTYIGNPWPKLFGGLTNSFAYRGFDLSILITGTYGNDIYNYMEAVNSNPNNINLSRNLFKNTTQYARVTTDESGNPILANPGTNVPRISYGPNGNYARPTSRWVEDGSYIRLKNISLSYNLPTSLLSKQRVAKGIRASVGVQNLLTITGYSGFDPEVGAYVGRDASASNQAIGIDFGRYPLTRLYSFTLGVNF